MSEVLEGKRGIITGGSGGIGMGCVRAFLDAGAEVAIFDREGEALEAAAHEVGDRGAIALAVDVTDPERVNGAVDEVASTLGSVDFLVNCAGIRYEVGFMDHTPEQ